MAKKTDIQTEIREKTEQELKTVISGSREALRAERFKDKFSHKASLIKAEKKKVARALTELNARRRKEQQS